MKKQPTEKEAVEIIAHYKFSDTQTETAEQIADKILSLGRTQAISEFKEKLKEILWDYLGERATGEYISRHYMERQIDKTAQEISEVEK